MSRQESGSLGGKKTVALYGKEGMSERGKKGGRIVNELYGGRIRKDLSTPPTLDRTEE